ncbi:MAG: hypothetical protein KBT11_01495, partial [Treponema sp.]|nr:hypothetical protein [Candidatus Treponema equifaecale]
LITGANSAAGGALFGVTPASVVNNPALTAWQQRSVLDVAATALVSSNGDDKDYTDGSMGSAWEIGLMIPSRWCVSTLLFQGIWSEFIDMPVGDSINFTAGVSKDITDQVSVGITADFGYLFGEAGSDWSLGANLGAYYNFGDWKFMKDIRFGASLMNLGKTYTDSKVAKGVDQVEDPLSNAKVDAWPGIATLKTGVAATFLSTDIMKLGLSLDASYPAFQDFVLDAGVQIQLWDFLKISSSWEYDVLEASRKAENFMPSVGVSFRFNFNSKKSEFMKNHGWEESEITVSGAWKQLYKNVNAISGGAVMELGLADTKAPEIKLWGEK